MADLRIDWPTVLSDIAYMLGEPDPANLQVRVPCSQHRLAAELRIVRGQLRNWLDGSEPKHADGEAVLARWSSLTGKDRVFAPRERRAVHARAR